MYATVLAGSLAYSFGNVTCSEIIPKRSFFSRAGFVKYAGRAGLQFVVPTMVGYCIGVALFGDPKEVTLLHLNHRQYSKELSEYKKELLYT